MYKKLFDKYERLTFEKLDLICKGLDAEVYPKVRIADVLPTTNSGLSNEEFSFSLKAHFDSTVCSSSTYEPLFSVEFDGNSHRTVIQKQRDSVKDNIVEKFNYPLLRINSKYLDKKYREFDLLTWCIEVWFSAQAFFSAQDKGIVPLDEPFSPESIYYHSGYKTKFPLFLSHDIRLSIRKYFNQNKIRSFCPNTWIGTDHNGNFYGICWLLIDDNNGILSYCGMKAQAFPVSESDLLQEIMVFDLFDQLSRYFKGELYAKNKKEIYEIIDIYDKKYNLALYSGGSS